MLSLKRIVIGWHVKVHHLPAVTPVTIVTITVHDNHPPMARSQAWIRATAATVMVIAVEGEGEEGKIKGVEAIRMLQGRGGMIGRCVRWGHDQGSSHVFTEDEIHLGIVGWHGILHMHC